MLTCDALKTGIQQVLWTVIEIGKLIQRTSFTSGHALHFLLGERFLKGQ